MEALSDSAFNSISDLKYVFNNVPNRIHITFLTFFQGLKKIFCSNICLIDNISPIDLY